jgi:hypothetical protein
MCSRQVGSYSTAHRRKREGLGVKRAYLGYCTFQKAWIVV